jgi:hypothetical protein
MQTHTEVQQERRRAKGEMSDAALRFMSNVQEHGGSFCIGRRIWMYGGRFFALDGLRTSHIVEASAILPYSPLTDSPL